MISPVWYNIRRVGVGKYHLTGEHDVDSSWMYEVRGMDSKGELVGRILPRFAVEGWDKDAYEEIIKSQAAQEEFTRVIIEQIMYVLW